MVDRWCFQACQGSGGWCWHATHGGACMCGRAYRGGWPRVGNDVVAEGGAEPRRFGAGPGQPPRRTWERWTGAGFAGC